MKTDNIGKLSVIMERSSKTLRANEAYDVEVKSIEEAVAVFAKGQHDDIVGYWGESNYQYRDSGFISLDVEPIARISFNGRVWIDDIVNPSAKDKTEILPSEFGSFLASKQAEYAIKLEKERDAEIAKKIDMDMTDEEYLLPIAVPILKAFENRLQKDYPETKILCMWADIGGGVYGLHLELKLSGESGTEDFYYSQRNGKIYEGLNGTPTEKIVNKLDLSSVVGEDLVNTLIEAMDKKAEQSLIRQLKEDMPDILNYQGEIYTMESYDMDGKEVTYGSPEAGKRITVTTDNRQESADDLAIEVAPLDYTLNHIVYTTNKEYHESDNAVEEAKARNAQKREEARSQKSDTATIKQGS